MLLQGRNKHPTLFGLDDGLRILSLAGILQKVAAKGGLSQLTLLSGGPCSSPSHP